jgi:hypothetical protein
VKEREMKTLLVLASVIAAATVAAGAGANGSPYSPGLVYGWGGVGDGDGVRFVAFGMPKSTIVAAVRARDGLVLRSNVARGFLGVPLVAYDGTPGGLSGDGRSLVLSSYGPLPGDGGKTRFVVVDTKTLRVRRAIVLDGSWSFDAVSSAAATLFLTEHLRAGTNPLYRVRSLDVRSGRLHGALVDKLEGERDMGGVPIARASSRHGRWAYTLYARRGHEPFVHAIDTAKRDTYCIDLPLELGYNAQWALKLKLDERSRLLAVRRGKRTLATVRTDSWRVAEAD